MKIKYILLIVLASIAVTQAQVRDARKIASGPTQPVVNEDRGRACIVVGSTLPGRQSDTSIFEPQQYSIFLGKGWAADSLRAREPALSNLIPNASDTIEFDYLERFGWKSLYSANNYEEKLIDAGEGGVVSDLQIQSVLSGIIKDNPAAKPGDDTVYVIYLEPALTSTLGPIVGGKHYFAYHNAFNRSDMRLRYVVVPYEENLRTAKRSALIGFISAVFQPDCRP